MHTRFAKCRRAGLCVRLPLLRAYSEAESSGTVEAKPTGLGAAELGLFLKALDISAVSTHDVWRLA